MWKFLSPLSCFTTRDFSSRSGRELGNNVLRFWEIPQLPSNSAPIPGVAGGWGAWQANMLPTRSSRLAGRDTWGPVEVRGGKQNGELRTVCDDATKGGSLEVKLNIHVFSLQRPERERLCFLPLSPSCPERASGTFPPSILHAPPPRLGERGHSQIERSCCCGWSWHCRKLQR